LNNGFEGFMKGNFEKLKIEIYGESHADRIGVRMSGIPNGCTLSLAEMKNLLFRRKSGSGAWATPRKEDDEPIMLAGLKESGGGFVTDGDIDICIENKNVRPSDYKNTLCVPRPSHADFAAYAKDGKISSGGGRFSGRMTAPLCIAGGIAQELLKEADIRICAYIASIGNVSGASYKTDNAIALTGISEEDETRIKDSGFPLLDESFKDRMLAEIGDARSQGDSVGGEIECVVSGLSAGMLGDALFEGLEGKLAYSIYAIPAVKGVEFGDGFSLSELRGSEANDCFRIENGKVVTKTNRSGGINGGITNGMPITLRVAVRPTPSISKRQDSVNLETMRDCPIDIKGRHDACIVPRAVPCVEAAVAIALLDEMLKLREGIELYH